MKRKKWYVFIKLDQKLRMVHCGLNHLTMLYTNNLNI